MVPMQLKMFRTKLLTATLPELRLRTNSVSIVVPRVYVRDVSLKIFQITMTAHLERQREERVAGLTK